MTKRKSNVNRRRSAVSFLRCGSAFLLALSMLVSLAACTAKENEQEDNGKLNVVCTLFPQYDFVREIAGDRVNLTLLLPPGVESHSYDPTPADIKAVGSADIVIRIGEGMETWSKRLFDSADGGAEFFDISEALDICLAEHDHDHNHEHEHEHGDEIDPHIWTDPVTAIKITEVITQQLCRLDPGNAEIYKKNSAEYTEKLEALNADIENTVKNAKRRTLIFSGRFALKNFTDRYQLQVISALDACADNSEPGAATVARIIDTVKADKIPIVFFEELTKSKAAEIICAETGARPALFHSCHNLSRDEFERGESYLSLMRQNAENLKEALS